MSPVRLLVLLGLLATLAACGKVGPPDRPGPQDQIIYPRQYPAK